MLFFFVGSAKYGYTLQKMKFVALYEMKQPCLMAQIKAFAVSFSVATSLSRVRMSIEVIMQNFSSIC